MTENYLLKVVMVVLIPVLLRMDSLVMRPPQEVFLSVTSYLSVVMVSSRLMKSVMTSSTHLLQEMVVTITVPLRWPMVGSALVSLLSVLDVEMESRIMLKSVMI